MGERAIFRRLPGLLLLVALVLAGCGGGSVPTPQHITATTWVTETPSPTPASPASPTPAPTPEPSLVPSLTSVSLGAGETVTITVLYDNNPYAPGLKTAWGFSCLIEKGDETVLFDTGGDALTLLGNMRALGIDPSRIKTVVLSHIHGDHVGGLEGFLALNEEVIVFIPRSFPENFKARLRGQVKVVEVGGPQEIAPGIHTTGEMGTSILEQGLVVDTPKGAVLITGCAHPGIVRMVEKARQMRGDVYLVMGGFHLGGAGQAKIARIISDFRRLGVQKVAPCHCSGDRAREAFRQEYGEDFIPAGVGTVIRIRK